MSKIVNISHHRVEFPGNLLREVPRRREDQQDDYMQRFDFHTLFSDAFFIEEGVELLGPPLLNTRDRILSSEIFIDGDRFLGKVESRDHHRISRTILHGVKSGSEILLKNTEGDVLIEINRIVSDFSGRRVLVTQQQNNPLEWIRYWVEFHAVHHGIDAVLIYDNRSTLYDVSAVEKLLKSIDSIAVGCVVDWDIPFGATGGPNQVWDSDFGQHQVLEHAMRYVLTDAKSVIQQDIDELAFSEDGRSICDILESSDIAELRYPRRQILQITTMQLPPERSRGYRLHCDYAYYRVDSPWMAGKYACVPSRIPRDSHYLVHGVENANRSIAEGIIARHYGGIRIDWRSGMKAPISNMPLSSVKDEVFLDESILDSYNIVPERGLSRKSWSKTLSLSNFFSTNAENDINEIDDLRDVKFPPQDEISRWRFVSDRGYSIEFAVLGNRGKPLVSSFHGPIDRSKVSIPLFERVGSLSGLPVSSVYFADPLLATDDKLELAWFEGGDEWAIIENMVRIVRRVAALGHARSIVHSGSSGGGFAALRAGAMMPGSTALVFNPQTAIGSYLSGGTSYASQKAYVAAVWPDVYERISGKVEDIVSFANEVSPRTSVLKYYEKPIASRVVYCNNVNDFHYRKDYLAFLAASARGGNLSCIEVVEYDGVEGHNPPSDDEFIRGLKIALGSESAMY
ncbi:hypothetical protein [Brevibacterium linens]|uniref:Uncharacterized protein n=1 Tax=Brevibacterium linens ATCC 9172 TaxID=1255617 RepID=A0A2H1KRL8_BRELN|nr:hypothetical protein [Brevibacterium linens]KAB1942287.1 hypothetical protein F8227_17320 [Brevibacterium linens ATCC 9172]SMY02321.1 hypothetical protein BLIN9172_03473 [Brevibacterium linens ATCC 9172]